VLILVCCKRKLVLPLAFKIYVKTISSENLRFLRFSRHKSLKAIFDLILGLHLFKY